MGTQNDNAPNAFGFPKVDSNSKEMKTMDINMSPLIKDHSNQGWFLLFSFINQKYIQIKILNKMT